MMVQALCCENMLQAPCGPIPLLLPFSPLLFQLHFLSATPFIEFPFFGHPGKIA
jgi:hypothetical protein